MKRETVFEQTAAGDAALQRGELDAAVEAYTQALEAATGRDAAVVQQKLGDAWRVQGELAASRAAYARALELAEAPADQAIAHDRLGDLALHEGNAGAARTHLEAGLALRTAAGLSTADSHARLADLARATGAVDTAVEHAEAALDAHALRLAQEPQDDRARRALALDHERCGDLAALQGDRAGAEYHLEAAVALTTALGRDPVLLRGLAVLREKQATVAQAVAELDAAQAHLAVAVALRQGLVAQAPGDAMLRRELAVSLGQVARLHAAAAAPAEALRVQREAIALVEPLLDTPEPAAFQRLLAVLHEAACRYAVEPEGPTAAEHHRQAALGLVNTLEAQFGLEDPLLVELRRVVGP